jgi:UDP-glucose 4-epimerase
MKKSNVLVTGAAGFMGSHLVDYLLGEGREVYGVDDLSGGYQRNVNPRSHFTRLDLREKEATASLVEQIKPQIIYHLAADATEGRSQFTPINCTERNYLVYLHLLIPAIKNGMEKMVVCSSMSVYGAQKPPFSEEMKPAPEDLYAISKAAMEKATEILSEVHGFKYTIFRPHNVYGPRQNLADPYRNVIGIFINCLLHDRNFYIYGDGEQRRAFSYIDDVTPYIAKSGFMNKADGEIFNIGPREEHTINEMAREVLSNFVDDPDHPPEHLRPKYLPARPKEVKEAFCTCEKAEKILGYQTTVGLSEGIRRMVEWAKYLGPQEFRYLESLELETKETPVTWKERLI